jgi:hypothetical protein
MKQCCNLAIVLFVDILDVMDYIFSLSTFDEVLQIDSAFRTSGAEPISVKLILFFMNTKMFVF